jgi:hypothetical protein
MIRSACLGIAISAAASACSSTPAGAATYVGVLNGIVSGEVSYYTYEDFTNPIEVDDLTGDKLTINFTADVTKNYTDPSNGQFYTQYVVESVSLTLSGGYLDNPGPVQGSSDNPYNNGNVYVDSQGKISGNFMYSGYFDPFGDYVGAEGFSFDGASHLLGPLTGSGSYDVTDYAPQGEVETNMGFSLTSGYVSQSDAPEPAAWTLLVCGFGVVGAAMRRRGPAPKDNSRLDLARLV